MPRRLSKFEIEWMEKEARARAAWGAYATHVRQDKLEKKCDDLRKSLSRQNLRRSEIERRVKELIRKESTGGLYIG